VFDTLLVIVLAGLVGPLLASGARPLIPAVVGELAAGVVLGRTGLGVVHPESPTNAFLYSLGFAMLMLAAGSHVQLRGAGVAAGIKAGSAALAVVVVLAVPLGLLIALLLAPSAPAGLFPVLLAGSSAAVAFPILQERGLLGPRLAILLAWIPLADALTVLAMPLTMVGAEKIPGALAGDAAIIGLTAAVLVGGSRLGDVPLAVTLRDRSRARGWALQLRLTLLILLGLSLVADKTGGSTLLAGFGAGLVLARLQTPERLEVQLSGLAEGFFVPAFFVLLGAELDFRALAQEPGAIALALAMAAAAVAIHVAAAIPAAPRPQYAFGLAASAQLGLPAAAASLGLATGHLTPALAAGIVAAGCLTMLPAAIGTRRIAATFEQAPQNEGAVDAHPQEVGT
jgi:Kef-type K+ transport system membrane component KefB